MIDIAYVVNTFLPLLRRFNPVEPEVKICNPSAIFLGNHGTETKKHKIYNYTYENN
jgi:hypothetical protein